MGEAFLPERTFNDKVVLSKRIIKFRSTIIAQGENKFKNTHQKTN